MLSDPELRGRLQIRFVIGRGGSVSQVSGGGDLADRSVVDCITRAFYGARFPQPEGGIVTVAVPITLSPSGAASDEPAPELVVEDEHTGPRWRLAGLRAQG